MKYYIKNEEEMINLGVKLSQNHEKYTTIYLSGDLGAGKTTLVRGFLRGLGYKGKIKSPTYTLVETYDIAGKRFNHFDLYRLQDPTELEQIGLDDYIKDQTCLIEWPERGGELLPKADVTIKIKIVGCIREVFII